MAIQPINQQLNTRTNQTSFKKQEKEVRPYLEANEKVTTENLVKPLPAQGHLIHDSLGNGVKYFFKDIAYDVKAVKDGFTGEANDHQLGRLNDVGLKLGGIGIATYLASRTPDPRMIIMEYVGLGTFLAAMSIYPKIAINKPGELIHGYEIDKEYIDDQGRKKSVFQDSNYIPYDMYRGEVKGEDLDEIGDKMGIPRDIHNRHDIIKEQMRKIATQNNTLWMLTAGLATPAMTALICSGLEQPIGYAIEKTRNASINGRIARTLTRTANMSDDIAGVKQTRLASRVEKLLKGYSGQEIPAKELDNIINVITENLDTGLATSVKEDITQILKTSKTGSEAVVLNSETLEEMIEGIKKSLTGRNLERTQSVIVPTREELTTIIANKFGAEGGLDGVTISKERLGEFRTALDELLTGKINALTNAPEAEINFLKSQKANALNSLVISTKPHSSLFVTEESLKEIVNFSKIIGEFKENWRELDTCKKFKFEAIQDSILARYYGKFEKTLLSELGISQKELKLMKESEDFAKQLLDKKLAELCKNEEKYKKTVGKLSKVMSEMEVTLHGGSESESVIKDLITAMENNYDKTAKRLEGFNGKFARTQNMLVKADVAELQPTIKSRIEIFDILDGFKPNKTNLANGIGSSKNTEISRIIDRYEGVKNTFNRTLHTMDFYRRSMDPASISANERLAAEIIKDGKEVLLNASCSDHTMKLHKVNNPTYYKELVNSVWQTSGEAARNEKGFVTEVTKTVLDKHNGIEKGNIKDRFEYYISRFKEIVGNNKTEFMKPKHLLNANAGNNESLFNYIGKSPVDLVKEGAGRKYITNKWLRIMGAFTAGVFGITLLAQFGFGKIRNPHNIKKQVENETK